MHVSGSVYTDSRLIGPSAHQSGVRWLGAVIKLGPDVRPGFIERPGKIGYAFHNMPRVFNSRPLNNLCVGSVTEKKEEEVLHTRRAKTKPRHRGCGSLGGFSLHPKH